ncbi:uncharacterized protein [Nicotiana sylvestris]|uniref:uncharacterized protein n=1 Tax=Nicotiana sylvestris TaxID=4096 RepID=UPI00388CC12D
MIVLCGAITKQAIPPTKNGNQYVDLTINNKLARAMVDTGATHNFVTEAAAKRLELKLAPTKSCIKTVNAEVQNTRGVANGVGVKLGAWKGMTNFSVTAMDIIDIILGQEFFRHCHTLIDPYLQPLLVMEREGLHGTYSNYATRKDPSTTFSYAGCQGDKEGGVGVRGNHCKSRGRQEFSRDTVVLHRKVSLGKQSGMPEELPKHFLLMREVDHKIELETGAKPPAFSPYRMAPPELEELNKQLKKLLDAGHIRPSKSLFGVRVLF